MARSETPPTTSRGEQTRQLILDMAIRRFADQGFRNTSVSAIARDLNLAPSAVYFHFADKEALFAAAFDRDAARLCDEALGLPGPVDPDYWQRVVARFVTAMDTHPLAHRVLSGREPELLSRLIDGDVTQRIRTAMENSLRAGQSIGDIAADLDPHDTAIALEAIFTAVVLTVTQVGGTGSSERVHAVGHFVRSALMPSHGTVRPTPGTEQNSP
ncbi:TetR/AcrR family transcriptional regulator [Nocardia sp. NPDC127526]|uniref:TetR/AcrR family transcriptional regulator n=1 Tax=Nocardia sp. NPDC127526 TaxID=3345393 RepID=UPI0036442EEF